MNKRWTILSGAGLGAGFMYLFDPDTGRRRRAALSRLWREAGRRTWGGLPSRGFPAKNDPASDRMQAGRGLPPQDMRSRDAVPSLHPIPGGKPRAGEAPPRSFPVRWLVGLSGGMLAFYGASRRGMAGAAVAALGMGVLGVVAGRAFRRAGTHRSLTIHKRLDVQAPVDRVYDFWVGHAHDPSFMTSVRSSRPAVQGQVIMGPSAGPMGWEARLVVPNPPRKLTWASEPGSAIHCTGRVRFLENSDHTTTLDLRMTYTCADRAAASAQALPVESDLQAALDRDLLRIKMAIESGITPLERPFLAAPARKSAQTPLYEAS